MALRRWYHVTKQKSLTVQNAYIVLPASYAVVDGNSDGVNIFCILSGLTFILMLYKCWLMSDRLRSRSSWGSIIDFNSSVVSWKWPNIFVILNYFTCRDALQYWIQDTDFGAKILVTSYSQFWWENFEKCS